MSERLAVLLDTATEVTTVGLARMSDAGARLIDGALVDAHRAAMSRLLPTLAALLDANGLSAGDIDEVVAGVGPGSFTGVRIGVATAKGLAHGLGTPLYGVGTLDSVAWGFAGEEALLGVLGDAMRGEVYPALFECDGCTVRRLSPDRVARPALVAGEWVALDRPLLLAGNGLRKYGSLFAEALGERATFAAEDTWAPSARGMLAAYAASIAAGERGDGDVGAVLPIYTRLSDAEESEAVRRAASDGAAEAGAEPR